MKKAVKQFCPKVYYFLKDIYHSTPIYKNKLRKEESLKAIKEEYAAQETQIMKEVFDNQYIVCHGPFKGMKYIKSSSGSELLPKILGSYEEPIQDWIREIINKKIYKTILNIGCAEGYYAVGFAYRMPNVKIIAYDIDEKARAKAEELKAVNGIENVEIKTNCTHDELNSMCQINTLVFCDIEGFEKILLDPTKAPNLKDVDLIIESHDYCAPNITEDLIKKFYFTHKIRLVVDYKFRLREYETPRKATIDQYNYILDEKRPEGMKFIYMERVSVSI